MTAKELLPPLKGAYCKPQRAENAENLAKSTVQVGRIPRTLIDNSGSLRSRVDVRMFIVSRRNSPVGILVELGGATFS